MILSKLFKTTAEYVEDDTSYFKTSPQAQSLRWIEEANPRNSPLLLWLSPSIRLDFDPD